MRRFAAGEIHVLVSTTVVEVGVDVPNATVMVVEHAERFGLAQLHQLRGRIGRGAHASTCVLLYDTPWSDEAKARLSAMAESDDGFLLAERDLALRGPGDVFGTRQSGAPLLRAGDPIRDADLLEHAHREARALVDADAVPAGLRAHVARVWQRPLRPGAGRVRQHRHAHHRRQRSRAARSHRRRGTGCGRRPTRCARRCSTCSGRRSPDAVVLDLCAGTGAIGLEALSRGAARAVFVDVDPRALRADRRATPARCGVENRCVIIRGTAVGALADDVGGPFDIVVRRPAVRRAVDRRGARRGRPAPGAGRAAGARARVASAAARRAGGCSWCARARAGDSALTTYRPAPAAGARKETRSQP